MKATELLSCLLLSPFFLFFETRSHINHGARLVPDSPNLGDMHTATTGFSCEGWGLELMSHDFFERTFTLLVTEFISFSNNKGASIY